MNRIYLIIISILICSLNLISADLKLKIDPQQSIAGNSIKVYHLKAGSTFSISLEILFDGVKRDILVENNSTYLVLKIPSDAGVGVHEITIDDIIREEVSKGTLLVLSPEFKDIGNFDDTDGTDGNDPDPNTQYGKKKNTGKDPSGKKTGNEVRNPSGGHLNTPFVSCELLHKIDGKFTDSIYNEKMEWSDIIPLYGRFSNLYMDFCQNTKTMYLLNDWYLGIAEYDSNSCYNKFELYTGGGSEHWEIWVYHSIAKGIKVIRNGIVVAENGVIDTNFVVGGSAGFDSSILFKDKHTIYEFAIKVKSGVFYLPAEHDPYQPPKGGTNVTVICDENGYGLVKEPHFFSGTFDSYGTTYRYHKRYIPESGVAGLEKEPNTFMGKLEKDNCNGLHKVDGIFTKFENNSIEWSNSTPAKGKYSNLYADFCDGYLYVLNDWKLGDSEPDQANCYNLFELFTAGGKQHWGIYVYHDPNKKIKVFLNGIDVSLDSNIVKSGAFGFDSSILLDKNHTIYEFAIKADLGDWLLYMADPGPSSFCDESDEVAPRKIGYKILAGSKTDNVVINYNNKINANYTDTITVSIGTDDEIENWFARKIKLTLNYDKYLTYPLINEISKGNNKLGFESLELKFIKEGQIEIEGISNNLLNGTGEIFEIKMLSLAGYDSISTLKGSLEIGNSTQYMYITDIKDIKIITKSDCPITNNLIKLSTLKQLVPYPNPVFGDKQISFNFESNTEQQIRIRIFNSIGNEITVVHNYNSSIGKNNITFQNLNLENGFYFISIDNGFEVLSNSIIISK